MNNEVVKCGEECANNTLDFIRRAVTSVCDLKEITDIEFVAMCRTLADAILQHVEKLPKLEHMRKVEEFSSDPYIVTLSVLIFKHLVSEVNHED